MFKPFKLFNRITSLDLIEQRIIDAEKALIDNAGAADHYAALAAGNKAMLARLHDMRAQLTPAVIPLRASASR